MSENLVPSGPWRLLDQTQRGAGYLRILGPNGEKICDLFPFGAGSGTVSETVARAIAKHIVASAPAPNAAEADVKGQANHPSRIALEKKNSC